MSTEPTAAAIATRIRRQIAARARTIPVRVTDVSMLLTQGFLWAEDGTTIYKVLTRTLEEIRVGDHVFIRKMTAERTSFWLYDSYNRRSNPDGTTTFQPSVAPSA